MANAPKPLGRLHSKNPIDAAWRAQQSQVDSDFAGLSRDPVADQMTAEMDAAGIDIKRQIKLLTAYFIARRDQKPSTVD